MVPEAKRRWEGRRGISLTRWVETSWREEPRPPWTIQ